MASECECLSGGERCPQMYPGDHDRWCASCLRAELETAERLLSAWLDRVTVGDLIAETDGLRAALESARCNRIDGDPCVLNKITVPTDWCAPCRAAVARLRRKGSDDGS